MTKFEKFAVAVIAILMIGVLTGFGVVVNLALTFRAEEPPKRNIPSHDYVIDLKPDGNVIVYSERGEDFIVHVDSLEEFIYQDNL